MRPEFHVRLVWAGEKFFGEGPYRLLRGVERLGSLRAAAEEMGMAYSKASRILSRAERLLGAALTERRTGGADGGGSALTPTARELMARYEAFRTDCASAVEASFNRHFGDFPAPGGAGSEDTEGRDGQFCSDDPPFDRGVPGEAADGDARFAGNACPPSQASAAGTGEVACSVDTAGRAPGRGVPGEAGDIDIQFVRADHVLEQAGAGETEMPLGRDVQSAGVERRAEESAASGNKAVSGEAANNGNPFASIEQPSGRGGSPSGNLPMVGCVVLAAGRSSRFGEDKLLAELAGRAVLARTLEALPRECFRRIVAVTRRREVSELCRALGVEAREYSGGALSDSIRVGLAAMEGTLGCLFVNGDQPLLRPESLRRMVARFLEEPDCALRLAYGGVEASPVLIPAEAYPALCALEGEAGGMSALRAGGWKIRAVEADAEQELWDVDTASALHRAVGRADSHRASPCGATDFDPP